MRSYSTMPMVPTPAATRYINAGQPKPPAPTTNTFPIFKRFCPSIPKFLMLKCRAYCSFSPELKSSSDMSASCYRTEYQYRRVYSQLYILKVFLVGARHFIDHQAHERFQIIIISNDGIE